MTREELRRTPHPHDAEERAWICKCGLPDYDMIHRCPTCEVIRTEHGGFGASHNGSKRCESGSIASGGQVAHCACDLCF